jgi:hypothetical protein
MGALINEYLLLAQQQWTFVDHFAHAAAPIDERARRAEPQRTHQRGQGIRARSNSGVGRPNR